MTDPVIMPPNKSGVLPFSDTTDIRCKVLSHALLAPSPHNTQPWKVEFRGRNRILLFVDKARLLSHCDPTARQAIISHGAFLENLDLAAKAFGNRADIELFPDGWPGMNLPLASPVASVDLEPDLRVIRDPLFDLISSRHTNRRIFERRDVPIPLAGDLTASYDFSYVPLGYTGDPDLIASIAELVTSAMKCELADRGRLQETLTYFRFTDKEVRASRDGLGLAQSGYGILFRFLIRTLILSRKRAEMQDSPFPRMAVKSTGNQARSTGGFAWLSTKENYRLDQIRAGRAFQRIHLRSTALGLSLQPMSQILEDCHEIADLKRDLFECLGMPETHTVQMLFRVGYASPVPPCPKRNLRDILSYTG
ncbi:MAG: hypothetical protein LUQ01_03215 [Methanolinea sp.]|nr:hypothetical protein [Methanolinea sp.]